MFTSIVVVGYFVVIAGSALLNSWRARYREAMSERSTLTAGALPAPVATVPLIIGAMFDFFAGRLWWWFAPVLSIISMLVGVSIYTKDAAIAVTPFIYTLF